MSIYSEKVKEVKNELIENICRANKMVIYIGYHFGVTDISIKGPSRLGNTVRARFWCMWFLRDCGYSWSELGRLFNRHHSSVIKAIRVIEDQLSINTDSYIKDYEELTELITNIKK